MGSFSYTCSLTNLPIEAGDEVKYVLFTENPYPDEFKCSTHDIWFPRTWPISAKYNDYGSIKDFDENSPAVFSIMAGFQKDLVEIGTGNNICHDVPAKKDMSFNEFLDAVWEGRISVKRLESSYKSLSKDYIDKHIDPALPTLKNVENILSKNNFTVSAQEGGLLVDERALSWIRVRTAGFINRLELLEKVMPCLQENFAAMITCGSDTSFGPEIQVMPKFREKEHTRFSTGQDSIKKTNNVVQAMILTKAWNALLNLISYKDRQTCKSQIEKVWNVFNIKSTLNKDTFNRICSQALGMTFEEYQEYISNYWGQGGWDDLCCKSVVPFTMGLAEHFKLVVARHKENPFSDQQIESYLKDVVDYCLIHKLMFLSRQYWKPGYSVGSQFGEYAFHADWHETLTKISADLFKQKRSES